MLRRIFGPKKDEETDEWIKLHNGELNDLYSSPNIVRVMKSRRLRWAELGWAGQGCVCGEYEGGGGVCIGFWWGMREGDR